MPPASSSDRESQRMLLEELNQLSMDIENSSFDTSQHSAFEDSLSSDTLALEFDADAFHISPSTSQQQLEPFQVTNQGNRIPIGTDLTSLSTTSSPKPHHASITAAAVTASFIVCRSGLNSSSSPIDTDSVQKRPRSPLLSIPTTHVYNEHQPCPSLQFLKDDINDSDVDEQQTSIKYGNQHDAQFDDDEEEEEEEEGEDDDNDNDNDNDNQYDEHEYNSSHLIDDEQHDRNGNRKRKFVHHQHHSTNELGCSSQTTIITNDPVSPRSVTVPISNESSPMKYCKSRFAPSSPTTTFGSTINRMSNQCKKGTTSTMSSMTTSSAVTSSDTMSLIKEELEDEEDEEDICMNIISLTNNSLKSNVNNNKKEKRKQLQLLLQQQQQQQQQLSFHHRLPTSSSSISRQATIVHPSTVPAIITNALACAKDPNSCRQRRAEAMERFRRKKAVRCYGRRVRYQIRKRIATTRPRVNGRFAKRSDLEAVLQKKATTKSND